MTVARNTGGQPSSDFRRSNTRLRGGLAHLVDDLAVPQEHDAVGEARSVGVVRHHQDRLFVVVHRVAEELQELRAALRVEVPGRLVGEDDGGPADERAGARDALLLPTRQLVRLVAEPVA